MASILGSSNLELNELSLGNNNFGLAGIKCFAVALLSNKPLRHLDLENT